MEKRACFIGHRNVPDTDDLRQRIRETVERLVTEENVMSFLFGSRSTFNSICHEVVTEMQKMYPDIRCVVYTCRHECVMKKGETKERIWGKILNCSIAFMDYDDEYEYPAKYTSGKASYVERNRAMINDSDFCVFYFDKTYMPPRRKPGNVFLTDYQPKSGTGLAYQYAVQKKKTVINLCGRV